MMGELIDRDAAIEMYGDWYTKEMTEGGFVGCLYSLLETLPAVDAAPVVHGRWVRTDSDTTSAIEYSCSICGDRAPMGYMRQNAKTEYCPHCGAKMDGGDE